ncbi:MAG: metal ABC transporter permease [Pirellulaceae bacterium]
MIGLQRPLLVCWLVMAGQSWTSSATFAQEQFRTNIRPSTYNGSYFAINANSTTKSITDRSVAWPTLSQWRRVLLLQDYNPRVVVLSVAILGLAAGVVGNFTLLRRRALIGDALAHASLPGIALAFPIRYIAQGRRKIIANSVVGRHAGRVSWCGMYLAGPAIRASEAGYGARDRLERVFWRGQLRLLSVIQQMKTGSAAGLETFIYGKTASIKQDDATLILLVVATISIVACTLHFKELKLLCFDQDFADSRGLSTILLRPRSHVAGRRRNDGRFEAVGLILVVALLC